MHDALETGPPRRTASSSRIAARRQTARREALTGVGRLWCTALAAVLAFSLVLPRGATAQVFEIEQMIQVAASGAAGGGTFNVYSTTGPASPLGVTENDQFSASTGVEEILTYTPTMLLVFHGPQETVEAGTSLPVTGSVESSEGIENALLNYRPGGEATFATVEMEPAGDEQFTATIPADAITDTGIAYFIAVFDSTGQQNRSPSIGYHSTPVSIAPPGLVLDRSLTSGSTLSAYQIVSVPLRLEASEPDNVFPDDLGPYDPDQWRLFDLSSDQDAREYPRTENVEPGKGFWLIVRSAEARFDTGPGETLRIGAPYAVPLQPRWNLIGNPFNFPVPRELLDLGAETSVELRSYDGGWNDPINDRVTELAPFTGYAVFNPSSSVDTLYVDPGVQSVQALSKEVLARQRVPELSWWIKVVARSGSASDADNLAGVSSEASSGWDPLDYPDPPSVGPYVSVYFPHEEWGRLSPNYATDIRPPLEHRDDWTFEVLGNTDQPVRLAFDGIRQVPARFDVLLIDDLLGTVTDLRERAAYEVSAASGSPRRLRLVVSTNGLEETPDFAADEQPGLSISPLFPNPLTSTSTVRYVLPEAAHARIDVFDVVGSSVATLHDSYASEGVHTLVWDGVGQNGVELPDGLYILRLQSAQQTATQSVVIVR
jgi:hypothetical protein